MLKRVIVVEGGASHIALKGFTIGHAAPTFLDSYECPSGGDWAIHRGAALFVEDARNVTMEGLTFDQVGGNAVMLSNDVRDSVVRGCVFTDTGDSAVALLGSTRLMVGTQRDGRGRLPTRNLVAGNLVRTVGVYGKQTSAYFKAKARANAVRGNVFANGPRAGVNFNDGTAGGEVLEGNLIFNFVRESGDHGMFNSWDRQPIVHDASSDDHSLGSADGSSADGDGRYAISPLTHQLRGNFIMNRNWLGTTRSGYCVDYDDGSSEYNATANFLVYAGFKVRDGVNRRHARNLIYGGRAADYQCAGYNSTVFVNNTVVDDARGKGIGFGCVGTAFAKGGPKSGSYNAVRQSGNRYFVPNSTAKVLPYSACGQSLAQVQAEGYEAGSTISADLSVDGIVRMAEALLGL